MLVYHSVSNKSVTWILPITPLRLGWWLTSPTPILKKYATRQLRIMNPQGFVVKITENLWETTPTPALDSGRRNVVLVFVPPPQETLQVDHRSQSLQRQSTTWTDWFRDGCQWIAGRPRFDVLFPGKFGVMWLMCKNINTINIWYTSI